MAFPAFAVFPFALSFTASVLLLVALVAGAAAYSIWAYRRTVPEISGRRRAVLTVLRALALSLVLFLIFEPILNLRRTETVEPHVAVLYDDSKSMTVRDGGTERAALVRALITDPEMRSLAAKSDIVPYRFAARPRELVSVAPDSLRFRGSETDIGAALVQAAADGRERNLRAIVLVSDGNVTAGKNPALEAEALGLPVFVVGVGDSTEKRDLLVSRILANSIAYVGSSVPVDVTIRGTGFETQSVQVTLLENGAAVDRKTVQLQPGSNEYPVQFGYEPKSDGVTKLTAEVTVLPGELTPKNNRQTAFIKVLKSKMNIVLVAGAPSADVALFEQAFRNDKNIAPKSFIQKFGATWYGTAPTQADFLDADCIVFVGYPLPQSGSEVLRMVRTALDKDAKPLSILFSREIDLGRLRAELDPYLPFDIVQQRREEAQVFFELPAAARRNPIVSTGIPDDVWTKLPPLFKTESSFKARVGAQTLGTIKINNIAFNEPLLLARKINRSKVLAWTGYGLWRWQLAYDVLGGKLPETLIANAIRWLTTRDDDKRMRIRPVKELFDSGERVEFLAQVYNESYEPVDNAVVIAAVRGPDGAREIAFTSVGAGRYTGFADGLREGDYTYTGTAAANGAPLGSDNGRFSVGELNVEFQETRLDNTLLRQIAARTGGRYFAIGDIGGLAEAVAAVRDFEPEDRIIRSDIPLWNLGWLLGAAVLLFAIEWYLRKQSGMI